MLGQTQCRRKGEGHLTSCSRSAPLQPGTSGRWVEQAREVVQERRAVLRAGAGRKEVGKEANTALKPREWEIKAKVEVLRLPRRPPHGHQLGVHPHQLEEKAMGNSLGTAGTATSTGIRSPNAGRRTKT